MNAKQFLVVTAASSIAIASIAAGGYLINQASIQKESTQIALANIYSHLDNAATDELKYSPEDYEAIIAMGGAVEVFNHHIAKGGLCEVGLDYASTFESVVVKASKHLTVDDKGKDITNYSALVEVKGSPESLSVNAKTFSIRVAKDLRSSLDNLISCHKELAKNATINELQG